MLLLVVLTAHLFLLFFSKFTLWPEMVVYPYLINSGFQLYKDIINPYPPLFTLFLSLFSRLFGYQPQSYQFLTWFLILTCDITIFLISRKIYKKNSYAVIATAFFALISLAFSVNGPWFDLAQTPLILLAFYFFQKFLFGGKSKELLTTAFLLTIAFFIKQNVVWFGVFITLALFSKFREKTFSLLMKNIYIVFPFLTILTLCLLYFFKTHTISNFVFWAFYFPFVKASQIPGYILLPTLKQLFVTFSLLVFFIPILVKGSNRSKLAFLAALSLLLFAYPRFDYFHLIPSLSLLSLSVGENITFLKKVNMPIKIISLMSLVFLTIFTARYLSRNWTQEVRFFEHDIFSSSIVIQKITKKNESIYIQNGPDQILPLSGRLPTKPWADDFPWYLEINNTQGKVLEGLEDQNPKYIISKPFEQGEKFGLASYRPTKIADFIDSHYHNVIQISDTLWLKERI